MPGLDPNQDYNVLWKLRCDAEKGEYTLTVEYFSHQPHTSQHRETHERLLDQATIVLLGEGIDPNTVDIHVIEHCAEQTHQQAAKAPARPAPATRRKQVVQAQEADRREQAQGQSG